MCFGTLARYLYPGNGTGLGSGWTVEVEFPRLLPDFESPTRDGGSLKRLRTPRTGMGKAEDRPGSWRRLPHGSSHTLYLSVEELGKQSHELHLLIPLVQVSRAPLTLPGRGFLSGNSTTSTGVHRNFGHKKSICQRTDSTSAAGEPNPRNHAGREYGDKRSPRCPATV